jgi:hypothetical protein
MAYPNTAPITTAEKGWGVVLAPLSIAVGIIALIALLLNLRWARWLGLLIAAVSAIAWAGTAVLLFTNRDTAAAQSYPFYPWLIFLAALFAVLAALAGRAFLAGLRSEATED